MSTFYIPSPAEIRRARENAGLTQSQAAELVCSSLNAWAKWEADEGASSSRKMHPAIWKLFQIQIEVGRK